MLTFAEKYHANYYSQFGEDGILREIIRRLPPLDRVCVEFGGHDGYFCSNTRRLIELGWTGFMYDKNPQGDVIKKTITPENVNELPVCDLISMDTDGPDLILWQAYNHSPSIVVIEINSSLPPDRDYYNFASGCSYKLMVETAISKGYFVVCHTGNIIAVLNKYRDLFPEIIGDGLENWPEYFNTSHLVGG